MVQKILHISRPNGSMPISSLRPHQSDRVFIEALTLRRFGKSNGKMPLPITFDNVECTMKPIKNNVKYFTRLVGNQSYFDLQGDRSLDEYQVVCTAVDRLAGRSLSRLQTQGA
ncbi:hypothetical protein Adt_32265 [Abeliophyllum distichum]|uniref:Uncharacterized protein n=1 Tax=Abeliophyllum distichum TaxID=126358 RepID=A0ABD1QSV6_9LAMI